MAEYKKDLFWANMPDSSKELNDLGFFKTSHGKMNYLKSVNVPYCIWSGVSRITKLENLLLPRETINSLNHSGFHVYLYEPLMFLHPIDCNDLSITIEILDSINLFVKNNKLHNVSVFTCDYNIQKLQHRYPMLKLGCLDIFLRGVSEQRYFDFISNTVQKKFWCGNWRYDVRRHIITSFLATLNGNYSWYVKCNFERLSNNSWFMFDNLKRNHPAYYSQIVEGCNLLENTPVRIDQDIPIIEIKGINDIPGCLPTMSKELILSYKECFCAIVNETVFTSPFSYLSEKTFYAINSKLSFVIVGGPHSLEYLKRLGFKTFDKWWDESYDCEEDPERRLIKILDVINFINSKSLDELRLIYSEMNSVLNHNRQVLNTIKNNQSVF